MDEFAGTRELHDGFAKPSAWTPGLSLLSLCEGSLEPFCDRGTAFSAQKLVEEPIRFTQFNGAIMRRAKPILAALVRMLRFQGNAIQPLNLRQEISFLGKGQVPFGRLDVQDAAGVREIELLEFQSSSFL